jgi:CheY-like chemotaxis protein
MELDKIKYNILKQCIDIYLKEAFISGIPDSSFNSQLISRVLEQKDAKGIFGCFRKEFLDEGKIKYSLQLGSDKYPYIKIVLMDFHDDDYGFLVDRHTEYMRAQQESKFYNKEVEIKDYTKELKLNIEDKWQEAGIPTYRELVKIKTKEDSEKISGMKIDKTGTTVLLAEDDIDIAKLHTLKLELLGYDVEHAINGEVCINMHREKKYDVLLLDLMMPTVSGFEVIKRIGNQIPIVVLSAISDKMTVDNCINDGAKVFLVKPVTKESLKDAIDKAIGR